MKWPKRVRTADWENGVLTLDEEKKFEVPELTKMIRAACDDEKTIGMYLGMREVAKA